jgi:mRNA interferase MazF
MVIVVPITRRERRVVSHVEVNPPEGGLTYRSFIKCEDVRAISQERLQQRLGAVAATTMARVELRLRMLLGL